MLKTQGQALCLKQVVYVKKKEKNHHTEAW